MHTIHEIIHSSKIMLHYQWKTFNNKSSGCYSKSASDGDQIDIYGKGYCHSTHGKNKPISKSIFHFLNIFISLRLSIIWWDDLSIIDFVYVLHPHQLTLLLLTFFFMSLPVCSFQRWNISTFFLFLSKRVFTLSSNKCIQSCVQNTYRHTIPISLQNK